MRLRCLISEASPTWDYRVGVIYNVPDELAPNLLALGKFEVADRKCPHCGGDLGEQTETGTMASAPREAVLSRASKRG
jgi:hypothetical protein